MPKTSFPAAGEAMPAATKLTTTILPDEMPGTYAMICAGHCLHPVFQDGQKLMFSSTERYRTGDFVVLFRRPELVKPGEHQAVVKKLVLAPPWGYWADRSVNEGSNIAPTVVVEMLNPRKMLYIDPEDLLGIHKCLGPVPADVQTYWADDEAVKEQARKRKAVAS